MAVREWEELNPDRLRHEMIFTPGDVVTYDELTNAQEFVDGIRSSDAGLP